MSEFYFFLVRIRVSSLLFLLIRLDQQTDLHFLTAYLKKGRRFLRFSASKVLNLRDFKNVIQGFPGGAVVENLPANAGDTGSSPGLGGSHMLRSN